MHIVVPPRAQYLRALMAELERLANHLGDIGAICNDASFSIMHAHCGDSARTRVARRRCLFRPSADDGSRSFPAASPAIWPKGGTRDPATLLAEIARRFPRLVELYDNTASLQDRTVETGIVRAELARRFGAGGYVGRASGRAFDARKAPALCAL